MMKLGSLKSSLPTPRFALHAAELLLAPRLVANLADRVRVESDLGEQFVRGGNIDVEVVLVHGQASCRGCRRRRELETVSLSPAGPLPGSPLRSSSAVEVFIR